MIVKEKKGVMKKWNWWVKNKKWDKRESIKMEEETLVKRKISCKQKILNENWWKIKKGKEKEGERE